MKITMGKEFNSKDFERMKNAFTDPKNYGFFSHKAIQVTLRDKKHDVYTLMKCFRVHKLDMLKALEEQFYRKDVKAINFKLLHRIGIQLSDSTKNTKYFPKNFYCMKALRIMKVFMDDDSPPRWETIDGRSLPSLEYLSFQITKMRQFNLTFPSKNIL